MIGVGEAAIGFGILVALLFIGLHVATAMFLVSVLGASIYLSPALVDALGTQLWASMEDYVLLSIPLYILLGEILVRSGSTDKLYRSLADWLNILPFSGWTPSIGRSSFVTTAISRRRGSPWPTRLTDLL